MTETGEGDLEWLNIDEVDLSGSLISPVKPPDSNPSCAEITGSKTTPPRLLITKLLKTLLS